MDQLTPAQQNALIAYAAKRLGIGEQALKDSLVKGDLSAVTGNLDPETAQKAAAVLGNETAVRAFLSSDAVKQALGGWLSRG